MNEERVYCRYEGDLGPRHLEGARLNMAGRLNWAMGIGEENETGEKDWQADQEAKRVHGQNGRPR